MTEAEALNPQSPPVEEFGEFGELKTKQNTLKKYEVSDNYWRNIKMFDIKSKFGEPHFKSKLFLNYNFLPVEDFICKVSDEYDAWIIGYIVDYKYPDNSINSGQGETVIACQWFKNTGECIISGENDPRYDFKRAFGHSMLSSINDITIDILYGFIMTVIEYIKVNHETVNTDHIVLDKALAVIKDCVYAKGGLDFLYCLNAFLVLERTYEEAYANQ